MKTFINISLLILLALFSTSCAVQEDNLPPTDTISDDQLALSVLVQFLQSLHEGQYGKAAQLYGGTYETMVDHNPDVSPGDHAALLQDACMMNGAECLQVKSASLEKKVSETEFEFRVELLNADGTLFMLEPCCGSNEKAQSAFYFTVVKITKERFVVMDMPPYVP